MRKWKLNRRLLLGALCGAMYVAMAAFTVLAAKVSSQSAVIPVPVTVFLVVMMVFMALTSIMSPLKDYLKFVGLDADTAPDYFAIKSKIRYSGQPKYTVNLEDMIQAGYMPGFVDVCASQGTIAIMADNAGVWHAGWRKPNEDADAVRKVRVVVLESLPKLKVLSECHSLATENRNFGYCIDRIAELDYALHIDGKLAAFCNRQMIAAIWESLYARPPYAKCKVLSDVTDRVTHKATN